MKKITTLIAIVPFMLTARPHGLNVKNGSCEVKNVKNDLELKCDDKSVLEWDKFSINVDEKITFTLPFDHASVLNRVVKDSPSEILGSLECNGRLYLVNPSGIIFGQDSVINCRELIASTLKINEEEFLKDKSITFENEIDSKLTHLGHISGKGNIYLISKQIDASGTIHSDGKVALVAANKLILERDENIFIELNSEELTTKFSKGIDQDGLISASQIDMLADGSLYDVAIEQSGVIDATNTLESGGKVFLEADNGTVYVKGNISASGKTDSSISINAKDIGVVDNSSLVSTNENNGGDIEIISSSGYLFLGEDSCVNVDAGTVGDGGTVIAFSDNSTYFHGNISARGGETEGDGGFVEVSGISSLSFTGDVTTKAYNGVTGKLLIDPTDITINNNPTTPPSFAFPPAQSSFTRPGPTATLNAADLVSQLDNNNVEVNTTPGAGAPNGGRIVVDADVQWTNGFGLTLVADENIVVNADIISGIGGFLSFDAGNNVSFRGVGTGVNVSARGGDIDIQSGNSTTLTAIDSFVDVKSLGGNLTVTSANNVTVTGSSTTAGGRAILGNQVFQSTFGDITVNATNNVNVSGGSFIGTNAGIRSNDGGGDVNITCNAMNINGGTAGNTNGSVFSARDIIIDTGLALNLNAGTVGKASIFSDAGTATIDVGTAGAANLTLTGNGAAEAVISADSDVNVSSTQNINVTNGVIISRQSNTTIDAINQINFTDAELNASNILTVQNSNLFTLDNSTAIGSGQLLANIPTIDLSNDALLRGGSVDISGNNLLVDNSSVRSPSSTLALDFDTVTLTNSANVFSSDDFTLDGRNLSLDNNSTITSDSNITITQIGVANDVQVLGTVTSSAIRSQGDLTIDTETLLVDNSELESFNQNVTITTSANTTFQGDAFLRADQNVDFNTGGNFLLDDSSIISTASNFTSLVTGTQTLQNNARIEASNIVDLQAATLSVDSSDIESVFGNIIYDVTNAFNITGLSQVSSLALFSGTSTDFTLDNSILNSSNDNLVVAADNISFLNGSTVTAEGLNSTAAVNLVLNNANVDVGVWTASTPALNVTDSLVLTEEIQFNLSTINVSNSQIFINDSLIEQP